MAMASAGISRDADRTNRIEINENERLIASDKVEGTSVYNGNGDHLGTVYNFMVDKFTGQVEYAVMSFGGFLGLGEKYHALPWKVLDFDTRLGGYVVNLDKKQLEAAPSYAANDAPWSDPAYGRRLYDYYGIAYPYI
jgi:hypothetical protein